MVCVVGSEAGFSDLQLFLGGLFSGLSRFRTLWDYSVFLIILDSEN